MASPVIIDLACHGHIDALENHIHENPASVKEKSWDGRTALHHASFKGRPEVCALLIANGANPNERDNIGRSALHYACRKGEGNICRLLIDKGATVDAKDKDEWTALHHASYNGFKDVCVLLVSNADCELNLKEKSGRTALHCAALNGHRAVCELLIMKGADINAKSTDNASALHYASFNGHRDLCDLLLANGANISSKSMDGQTPLHLASRNGHKEVCKIFLAKNKEQLQKVNQNQALTYGSTDPVLVPDILTEVDNEGHTPADCAKSTKLSKLLSGDTKAYDNGDTDEESIASNINEDQAISGLPKKKGTTYSKQKRNSDQSILSTDGFSSYQNSSGMKAMPVAGNGTVEGEVGCCGGCMHFLSGSGPYINRKDGYEEQELLMTSNNNHTQQRNARSASSFVSYLSCGILS